LTLILFLLAAAYLAISLLGAIAGVAALATGSISR
jgi:hypothetical protein